MLLVLDTVASLFLGCNRRRMMSRTEVFLTLEVEVAEEGDEKGV